MEQSAETVGDIRWLVGQLQRVTLGPDDVLVLRSALKMSNEARRYVTRLLKEGFGEDRKVLILDPGMTLGVCGPKLVAELPAAPPDCDAESLTVTRAPDGSFTVERWVPRLLISPMLLADAPLVQTTIAFRASGQVRRYRVVGTTNHGDLIAEDLGGSDADG